MKLSKQQIKVLGMLLDREHDWTKVGEQDGMPAVLERATHRRFAVPPICGGTGDLLAMVPVPASERNTARGLQLGWALPSSIPGLERGGVWFT